MGVHLGAPAPPLSYGPTVVVAPSGNKHRIQLKSTQNGLPTGSGSVWPEEGGLAGCAIRRDVRSESSLEFSPAGTIQALTLPTRDASAGGIRLPDLSGL